MWKVTYFYAFKRHIRKKHCSHLNNTETDGDTDSLGVVTNTAMLIVMRLLLLVQVMRPLLLQLIQKGTPTTDLDRETAVALWILKLKEGCILTQSVTKRYHIVLM